MGPHHRHDDHHGHGGHDHAAPHAHVPARFGRAFAIGIALNSAFVLVEAAAGFLGHSVALVADAGHNLSDVLGLAVAWGGATLARRPPSRRFTYGLRGSTILAALFNAIFLLVAMGAIALEAAQRFGDPVPTASGLMMAVAGAGILVNGATALLFARGQDDLNIRGAYLHMASDAAVSAGVVLAGAAIWLTELAWIDSVVSLLIVLVVVWGTWGLLRDAVTLSLAAVPPGLDIDRVEGAIAAIPGVRALHHLHLWAMSTTETALTAHVALSPGVEPRALRAAVRACLAAEFGIAHVTLEVDDDAAARGCAPARG